MMLYIQQILGGFLLLMISTFTSSSLAAQSVEVYGAVTQDHYRISTENEEDYSSSSQSGNGYTIGFSFDNPNANGIASRISIAYTVQRGSILTEDHRLVSDHRRTEVDIETQRLDLAVYPFTFFLQRLQASFGARASFLLDEVSSGSQVRLDTGVIVETPIEDVDDPEFHKSISYGVVTRLAYTIPISQEMSIVPQYQLYLGLSKDFETAESTSIKTWQQSLAIGVTRWF